MNHTEEELHASLELQKAITALRLELPDEIVSDLKSKIYRVISLLEEKLLENKEQ